VTKEQLRAYRAIRLERDKLRGLLEEMEATIYSPAIPKLDPAPGGGRNGASPVEIAATKHDELRTRYLQKVAELEDAMAKVEAAIETLDHRDRALVRLYYIQGKTWEEVCVEMSYSWRQIHRIHSEVLKKLRDK
jgi:RNA polymerase sigma factor (sigma-70 family)